jgi:hypothetical protein
LELYQWDGFTTNNAVKVVGSDKSNISLELKNDATLQSYVPLRGVIDSVVVSQGVQYRFDSYRLFWSPEIMDSTGRRAIPVNQFYSQAGTSIYDGEIIPNIQSDLWSTKTDSVPVLGYWNATSCNGAYRIWLEVVYRSALGNIVASKVDSRVVTVGSVIHEGDETLVVSSQEKRATVSFPASQVDGAVVSLSTIAPSELSSLISMPDITPIGPVLKLQTTGKRVFDEGEEPVVEYRIAAREVFTYLNMSNFDLIRNMDSIYSVLESQKASFQINLLAETGKLEALPTLVSIDSNLTDRDAIALVLRSSVPHFSYALVLPKDNRNGEIPLIDSVKTLNDSVTIWGSYSNLMVHDTIPVDLQLIISTAISSSIPDAVILSVDSIPVNHKGKFRYSVLKSKLGFGIRYAFAKYAGATKAARQAFFVDDGVWDISDWTEKGNPITPVCGLQTYQASFTSDQTGDLQRLLLDSNGVIRTMTSARIRIGSNKSTWDGCVDGVTAAKGRWTMEYRFVGGPVVSRLVGVQIQVPSIVSVNTRFATFVPSLTNAVHLQQFQVHTKDMGDDSIHVVLVNANGDTLLLQKNTRGTIAVDGSYNATFTWRGLGQNGMPVAAGTYRLGVWIGDSYGLPSHWSNFRVDSIASDPGVRISSAGVLTSPVLAIPLEVSAKRLISGSIEIIGSDNKAYKAYLNDSVFTSGSHKVSLAWTEKCLPKSVRLSWSSEDGLGGVALANIQTRDLFPTLRSLAMSGDTIYPEISADWVAAMGHQYYPSAAFDWISDGTGSARIEVRNDSNRLIFVDTTNIVAGPGRLAWFGKASLDSSLVEQGNYTMRLLVSSPMGVDSVVDSRPVRVVRFPDAAIVVRNGAPASVHQFAGQVLDSLNRLGVKRVGLVDEVAAKAFMALAASRPNKGLVIFIENTPPSSLFHGEAKNPIYLAFREGVQFAFYGGQPLRSYRSGSTIMNVDGASLPLFGLGTAWATSAELALLDSTLFSGPVALGSINPLYVNSLRDLASRISTSHIPQGESIRLNAFKSNGVSQFIALDSTTSANGPLAQNAYYHPVITPYVGPQSGFLVFNPYGDEHRPLLAGDYASAINRLFFSPDLGTGPGMVRYRSDRADTTQVARGSNMTWTVDARLQNKAITNGKLVVSIPGNNNSLDTVDIIGIDPFNQASNHVSINVHIDSAAAFDTLLATLRLLPLRFADPQDSTVDREEEDLSNNTVVVPFVVRDTASPVLIWNASRDTLPGFLSSRYEAYTYGVAGNVSTRHNLGMVKLKLTLHGATNIEINDSIPATAGSFLLHVPPQPALGSLASVRAELVAEDYFGNLTTVNKYLRLDGTPPIIDSLDVLNKIHSDSNGIVLGTSNAVVLLKAHDDHALRSMLLKQTYVLSTDSALGGQATNRQSTVGLNPGVLVFDVRDSAGNLARKTIPISLDTTKPSIAMFRVLAPSWPKWLDASLDSVSSASIAAKVKRWKYYPSISYFDGQDTLQGVQVPNPDSTWLLAGANGGSWKASFDAKGMDTVKLVMQMSEANPASAPIIRIDGIPYIGNLASEAISAKLKPYVSANWFAKYIKVPVKQGTTTVTVSACDLANQCVSDTLEILNPLARLAARDPQGDTVPSGPDFGEIYASRNDSAGVSRLQFMLHQWNNGFTDKDISTAIYLDLDHTTSTGSSATVAPGLTLLGFDRRIVVERVDSRDVDINNQISMQFWNGTAWAVLERIVGNVRSGSLEMGANQTDDYWSPDTGEGIQVLPSGNVALAPGGLLEIRAEVPSAADSIRWVIVGDADAVFDTSSREAFVLGASGSTSLVADGRTRDWLSGNPSGSFAGKHFEATGWMEQVDSSAVLLIKVQNTGLTTIDEMNVRVSIAIPLTCADPLIQLAMPPGQPWWIGPIMPGSNAGDRVLSLKAMALTPGSSWTTPALMLGGCGLNANAWTSLEVNAVIEGIR